MPSLTLTDKLDLAARARTYLPIVEHYLAGRPVGPQTRERLDRALAAAVDPNSPAIRLLAVEERVRATLTKGTKPDAGLAIVRVLAEGEATVAHVARVLLLPYTAVSAAMLSLERRGIVTRQTREGSREVVWRIVWCSAVPAPAEEEVAAA